MAVRELRCPLKLCLLSDIFTPKLTFANAFQLIHIITAYPHGVGILQKQGTRRSTTCPVYVYACERLYLDRVRYVQIS